jgi:hypothetical protein
MLHFGDAPVPSRSRIDPLSHFLVPLIAIKISPISIYFVVFFAFKKCAQKKLFD